MKLIRLLKLLKTHDNRMNTITREVMHLNVVFERLFLLILISSLAIHLITCLWLFSAMFTKEEYIDTNTWLSQNNYDEYSPTRQYLASLYMTTIISYGNVYALNDFERIFSLAIMIMGGLLMAQGISTLSQIIVSMDHSNARFEQGMEILNRISN